MSYLAKFGNDCHLEASGSQAITYEEFADLIYGPRLAVGDSPQEAQDCSAGEC